MRSPPNSRRRLLAGSLLAAAVLLPPLVTRALLLLHRDLVPGRADATGFGSDVLVSLLMLALVGLLGRTSRIAAGILLAAWGFLHYANYESVLELGSSLRLEYAGYLADPTFLRGSAAAFRNPWMVAVMVLGTPLLAVLSWKLDRRPLAPLAVGATGLLGLACLMAVPEDTAVLSWRQSHVLPAHFSSAATPTSTTAEGLAEVEAVFRQDLDGEPLFPLPGRARNVLLVILEGIGGSFLDGLGEGAGLPDGYRMPLLSRLADQHIVATNFVLHQRQTNRGVYSILCGDYPKLETGLAKMTEALESPAPPALPSALAAHGYVTVYLQAAPLAFMLKDAFMAKIGFERVLGNSAFKTPRHRSQWGVDDGSLFARAALEIEQLRRGQAPWFLTLLTVGTHHPTTVPEDLEATDGEDPMAVAVRYLDTVLADFVSTLAERGVLEDTLVLITSDESRGLGAITDDVTDVVTRNWGILVMLEPSGEKLALSAPVAQSDLALSIVDYLGLDAPGTGFIGRSAFRKYDSERRVYFSNTFLRRTGWVDSAGVLALGDEELTRYARFQPTSPYLFGPARLALEQEDAELALARSVVARSLGGGPTEIAELELELLQPDAVPVLEVMPQILMGGQNLYVPAGTRIRVEIKLSLAGARGSIRLSHALRDREQTFFKPAVPELSTGRRLVIRYEYATAERIDALKCQLRIEAAEGQDLAVQFQGATLSVHPLEAPGPGEPTTSGLVGKPVVRVRR